MTLTTTGAMPQLIDDAISEPRTQTAAYFADGRPAWGSGHARPAISEARRLELEIADLKDRLAKMMMVATEANRDAVLALDREDAARADAADAEVRFMLAQETTLRVLRRSRADTLEAAFDRAARSITGRSHVELVDDLDREDDDDTVVVDLEEDHRVGYVARALAASRHHGHGRVIVGRQFGALADLVEEWLDCARAVHEAESMPAGYAPHGLLVALDTAERKLEKAVRR